MLFFIWKAASQNLCQTYLNTSHVILYRTGIGFLDQSQLYLNTSHVILYQCWNREIPYTVIAFKYISCYSLSELSPGKHRGFSEFKYISCYSLSQQYRR